MIHQYPSLLHEALRRRLLMQGHHQPTYVLGMYGEQPVIVCLCCGQCSTHPTDITERFCGYCGVFHEEERPR